MVCYEAMNMRSTFKFTETLTDFALKLFPLEEILPGIGDADNKKQRKKQIKRKWDWVPLYAVLHWVPWKQTLRWRAACRLFPGRYSWEASIQKWGRQHRIEGEADLRSISNWRPNWFSTDLCRGISGVGLEGLENCPKLKQRLSLYAPTSATVVWGVPLSRGEQSWTRQCRFPVGYFIANFAGCSFFFFLFPVTDAMMDLWPMLQC